MLVLRCSSSAKSIAELAAKSGEELLFLAPDAAKTEKELEAAFYFAREAVGSGTGISDTMAKEALLFLSCEMNFSSALKKVGASSPEDFVLVSEKKIPLARLKKELMLVSAKAMKLPELGKRVGGYTEGELAIERMALARVKN
ncbi:MAG: hypothetical protein QW568_05230 [Candidatus Anstonellaceae archaeon]